jgi:membrane protease YdiL (CAAX protease family)
MLGIANLSRSFVDSSVTNWLYPCSMGSHRQQSLDYSSAVLAIFGGLAVIFVVGFAVELALSLAFGEALTTEISLTAILAAQPISVAIWALLLAGVAKGGLSENMGFVRPRTWWPVLLVVPAGFTAAGVAELVRGLAPSLEMGSIETLEGIVQGAGGLGLLAVVSSLLLAPLGEEFIFRGVVYRGISNSFGAKAAIIWSGVAFALYHIDPVHAAAVLLMGIWFGWLRWYTGSIVPCILAHVMNNSVWLLEARWGMSFGEAGVATGVGGLVVLIAVVLWIHRFGFYPAGQTAPNES